MLFRSPKPQTPNPKPQTPNPKPQTPLFWLFTVSCALVKRFCSVRYILSILFLVIFFCFCELELLKVDIAFCVKHHIIVAPIREEVRIFRNRQRVVFSASHQPLRKYFRFFFGLQNNRIYDISFKVCDCLELSFSAVQRLRRVFFLVVACEVNLWSALGYSVK